MFTIIGCQWLLLISKLAIKVRFVYLIKALFYKDSTTVLWLHFKKNAFWLIDFKDQNLTTWIPDGKKSEKNQKKLIHLIKLINRMVRIGPEYRLLISNELYIIRCSFDDNAHLNKIRTHTNLEINWYSIQEHCSNVNFKVFF